MPEINPELVQNIGEERKRWLPGFAEIANKFLNSEDAVTLKSADGQPQNAQLYRFIACQTDDFIYRFRVVRWGERSREILGDRVTLEWMQRPTTRDYIEGYSPRWGFISIGYENNQTSVLAEELPRASMDSIEQWNNGKSAMEIADLEYPEIVVEDSEVITGAIEMSPRDVTKLLLEAKGGKVNKVLTKDMVDCFMEGYGSFDKTPNESLGIKIPISSEQSISF